MECLLEVVEDLFLLVGLGGVGIVGVGGIVGENRGGALEDCGDGVVRDAYERFGCQ